MLVLMECPNCGHVWRRIRRVDLNDHIMRRQYEAGATIRQLAKTHGCAYSTVRKRLLDVGATMRPRARKRDHNGVR